MGSLLEEHMMYVVKRKILLELIIPLESYNRRIVDDILAAPLPLVLPFWAEFRHFKNNIELE